jgi:hypothetical protein
MFSGEKILADGTTIEGLRVDWPQALGVEMEGLGTALACYRGGPAFLIIRAISDFADADKNYNWHDYAAEAAARFAVAVLERSGPPPSSRSRPQAVAVGRPLGGDTHPANLGARLVARRQRTLLALLAGSVTVLVAIVTAIAILHRGPSGGANQSPPPDASSWAPPAGSTAGVPAVVQNTWEESEQRDVGVYFYPDPYTNQHKRRGVDEGTRVIVTCQVRDGRLATDTPHQHRQTSSQVWDLLSGGYFISDIYTNLPKTNGEAPPPGVPLCIRKAGPS